jgi:crotonobetainyl-CoA:carnitine CoA-transferase CaiB-like acyl-CoA transferase
LGEHTVEILGRLGLDEEQIKELAGKGIVSTHG